MTKVLVFGTYDILHPGHIFFLKKAKSFGNDLNVVIARDETVKKVKGKLPINNEKQRRNNLLKSKIVDNVFLGYLGDKYKIIEKILPDIIILGYDQKHFIDDLPIELKKRKINAKIIRIDESHKPHIYKSSLLGKDIFTK